MLYVGCRSDGARHKAHRKVHSSIHSGNGGGRGSMKVGNCIIVGNVSIGFESIGGNLGTAGHDPVPSPGKGKGHQKGKHKVECMGVQGRSDRVGGALHFEHTDMQSPLPTPFFLQAVQRDSAKGSTPFAMQREPLLNLPSKGV